MIEIRHTKTVPQRYSSFLRIFHKIRLKGEKVRCNVCGNNFRKFRSYGHHKRKNVLCPECYSLESTRLLWFYLTNEVLNNKKIHRILYFAPEKTILEKFKNYKIELVISNIQYLNSLNNLKLDDKLPAAKFDVIIFSHIMQYIQNEIVVFEELKRLLRPGGYALIVTIINWQMDRTYNKPETSEDKARLISYFEPGVERIYGANFYKLLINAGFNVEMIDYADQLGSAAKEYYQLGTGAREMIFKCTK